MRRIANVLDKLPKRLHAKAKAALHEIMRAESRKAAEEAIEQFEADYGAKYPKAVASLRRDEAELLFGGESTVHISSSTAKRNGEVPLDVEPRQSPRRRALDRLQDSQRSHMLATAPDRGNR